MAGNRDVQSVVRRPAQPSAQQNDRDRFAFPALQSREMRPSSELFRITPFEVVIRPR